MVLVRLDRVFGTFLVRLDRVFGTFSVCLDHVFGTVLVRFHRVFGTFLVRIDRVAQLKILAALPSVARGIIIHDMCMRDADMCMTFTTYAMCMRDANRARLNVYLSERRYLHTGKSTTDIQACFHYLRYTHLYFSYVRFDYSTEIMTNST